MPRVLHPDTLISMKEAQKLLLSSFHFSPKTRMIAVRDAAGHILAEPVYAPRTIPPAPYAGIDGIAIKSKDTKGASEGKPKKTQGILVNIGLPMPTGYDAVIPDGEGERTDNTTIRFTRPVPSMRNVIPKGAESIKEEPVLPSDHYLIPYDIAALSHLGVRNVSVRSWKINMIATGDEIIPFKKDPRPGETADTNTMMIAGYLQAYKVLTETFPIIPDDADLISARITSACENCDMVLLFGGTSGGSKDYTIDAIEKSGRLLYHGVAMEPGMPVSCGTVQGKPVFGMPGQAIATLITFFQLVFPLLKSWGVPIPPKKNVIGEISTAIEPVNGFDLFRLVTIRYDDGIIGIIPLEWRFGHSMGLTADGILHLPRWSNGFKKGEKVQVTLIR